MCHVTIHSGRSQGAKGGVEGGEGGGKGGGTAGGEGGGGEGGGPAGGEGESGGRPDGGGGEGGGGVGSNAAHVAWRVAPDENCATNDSDSTLSSAEDAFLEQVGYSCWHACAIEV